MSEAERPHLMKVYFTRDTATPVARGSTEVDISVPVPVGNRFAKRLRNR